MDTWIINKSSIYIYIYIKDFKSKYLKRAYTVLTQLLCC